MAKKVLLVAAALALCLAAGCSSSEKREPRLIKVSANGEAKAAPDIAVVHWYITATRPKPSEARDKADQLASALTAALGKAGVAGKDIATTQYSIITLRDYERKGAPITGYQAKYRMEAIVRDLDKLTATLQAAEQAGVGTIEDVEFKLEDSEKAEQEAILKAAEAANRKADALARQAGVSLGRVHTLEAQTAGPEEYFARRMAVGAEAAGTAAPISPGQMTIRAAVTASYEIK